MRPKYSRKVSIAQQFYKALFKRATDLVKRPHSTVVKPWKVVFRSINENGTSEGIWHHKQRICTPWRQAARRHLDRQLGAAGSEPPSHESTSGEPQRRRRKIKFRYLGVFWYRTYGPVTSISGRSILGHYLLENAFKERDVMGCSYMEWLRLPKLGTGFSTELFLIKLKKNQKISPCGLLFGSSCTYKKVVQRRSNVELCYGVKTGIFSFQKPIAHKIQIFRRLLVPDLRPGHIDKWQINSGTLFIGECF